MNFRLQQFLAAENITQAQFADEIGVARASVSHIIAGRNKPGFDFIQNMSRRYPDLNLEWLIQGKGRMYKDDRPERPLTTESVEGQLFPPSSSVPVSSAALQPEPKEVPESTQPTAIAGQIKQSLEKEEDYRVSSKVQQQVKDRRITRIVVFYDDNTYQELREA